jgi:hypothetical protein
MDRPQRAFRIFLAIQDCATNLSLIRRWLGDEPVFLILLDDCVDIERFGAAFPEAMIVVRQQSEDKIAQ